MRGDLGAAQMERAPLTAVTSVDALAGLQGDGPARFPPCKAMEVAGRSPEIT